MLNAMEASSHTCVDEMLYAFRVNCPFWEYMYSETAKYQKFLLAWTHLTSVGCSFMFEENLNKVNKIRTLE